MRLEGINAAVFRAAIVAADDIIVESGERKGSVEGRRMRLGC